MVCCKMELPHIVSLWNVHLASLQSREKYTLQLHILCNEFCCKGASIQAAHAVLPHVCSFALCTTPVRHGVLVWKIIEGQI